MLVTSDLAGFSFALGLHFDEALALAGILSLSSLGLVAKVLADSGHLKEPIGLKIFTIVAHRRGGRTAGSRLHHWRTP